jgi:hypothetical protein
MHNMEAYKGIGDEAPLILNLDTRLRWVVNFTSRPIYLREKSSRYTLIRRLDGPRAGLDLMRKGKLLAHTGIRTTVRPARSLVTILPTLPRLPYSNILWRKRSKGKWNLFEKFTESSYFFQKSSWIRIIMCTPAFSVFWSGDLVASDSMHLENRSVSHHVCICGVRLTLFARVCNEAG